MSNKKAHKKPEQQDIERIQKELENCLKEKQENIKGWQRERADFLNHKKKEVERNKYLKDFVREEIFLELLENFDNFDLAEQNIPEKIKKDDWFQGFKQIKKQFSEFLDNQGIQEINAENQKFNPGFHEAMEFIEKEDCKSGEIIEVVKKGYTFNEKVLRPAKVRVCK